MPRPRRPPSAHPQADRSAGGSSGSSVPTRFPGAGVTLGRDARCGSRAGDRRLHGAPDGGRQRDAQHRGVQALGRGVDGPVQRVDGDALALLLVGQPEPAHLVELGPGVHGRLAVVAHDDVPPVGEERRVGRDREHRAHLGELVGPVGPQPLGSGVHRPAEDALADDVQLAVAGSASNDSASRGPSGKTSSYDGTSTSRFPRPTGTRATETDGRSARLSPMSPTQTSPPPAGARASTSTGSADHCVTPTVSPVAGSTVKTRPESPESLVVTSRPSTTARPLDSTISGSSNRVTSLPAVQGARQERGHHERDRGHRRAGTAHAWSSPARSSASLGRIPHVATRSSYSVRTAPPETGPPVRTARSRVLRGVCLLSTNCITSTR